METALSVTAKMVALGLEALAVLVIALGGLEASVRTIGPWLLRRSTSGTRRRAWLSFARWLILGLEFTLAADIVRSAIAPDWDDIGRLAAIAAIRTFLNLFLERDLKEATRMPEISE